MISDVVALFAHPALLVIAAIAAVPAVLPIFRFLFGDSGRVKRLSWTPSRYLASYLGVYPAMGLVGAYVAIVAAMYQLLVLLFG